MKTFRNIHEIIPSTIQGEGFNAGKVCSFLRLYGCPVGCDFCDTGYAKKDAHGKYIERFSLEQSELASVLHESFVVISGGEPASHPQFQEVVNYLLSLEKHIAIETSGIHFFDYNLFDLFEGNRASRKNNFQKPVWITVSPKAHTAPERYTETSYVMWEIADELKFVIRHEDDWHFYAPKVLQFHETSPNTLIYLQPEWSLRESVLPLLLKIVHRHPFLRLSVQTHKYLGIQ